ncbi:DUF2225 domain-containing protein [Cytobacillus sp. IB215665]|uniref:DUF2225 domain-containing protein n=1 Tax=Cytobacillus sp. IB215665 TaxID=3097357 RepID=UPI002A0DD4C4|nr:DUF2225 domain-containing protein [Cytobacillus sp. IB215665]MDX8365924.1 DUF2225 domain-containing protein [Cytobacillus sp. IB215665]
MNTIPPFYDYKPTCLLCKKTYTTQKVRSRYTKISLHESDFCPQYKNEAYDPSLYYICVCPHCGFSSSNKFEEAFPPLTIETLKKNICDNWAGKNYCGIRTKKDAIDSYKLAIYSALLKKEKHITIAGMYLRTAWLYRKLTNQKQEKRFMKLALQEYIQSYMTDDFNFTQMSEIRILYMIGELNRRIGNDEQAIRYFSKVLEQQHNTIEYGIISMTRERWYEIRQDRQMVTLD